jgi:hypothetical protein
MEPIKPIEIAAMEAAVQSGGDDEYWFARITWKCPICGRRSRVLKTGGSSVRLSTGHGQEELQFPMEVICKQGHKTLVKPYRT